ncbi:MAG: hypothetical protein WDZ94_00595 [Patescibacteria group bacterium]
MRQFFRSTDAIILAGLLLLVTLLRLPNFFEPYWYGDEAIYLTIGNALNYGEILYQDIVDHKTPGIYWLAQVGTQLNFRIVLMGWMLASTTLFFLISKQVCSNRWSIGWASLFFVIFTSIPFFEGNIPNGELFVIGFVLLGTWLLLQSTVGQAIKMQKTSTTHTKDFVFLLGSGAAFGLAILVKIPALFDWLGAISLLYFIVLRYASTQGWKSYTKLWQSVRHYLLLTSAQTLAVLLVLAASIGYFWLIGAGSDYLEFGLLYNFHYAGNWEVTHLDPKLAWWFSLPGKATFLAVTGVILSFISFQKLSVVGRWLGMWVALALIAALLSNRPYPHYFLQIIPPLALLLGHTIEEWSVKRKNRKSSSLSLTTALTGILITFSVLTIWLINAFPYPTISYYATWYRFMTNQITPTEYRDSFNYLLADNYRFNQADLVQPGENLFIWGTNPMLYAQTQTIPVGRFTVAFHIHDLGLYSETMQAVERVKPKIIITQHAEDTELPGLNQLLEAEYVADETYDHFTLWQLRDSIAE